MLQFASEINTSCPLMVDQVTRLDNVMAMLILLTITPDKYE